MRVPGSEFRVPSAVRSSRVSNTGTPNRTLNPELGTRNSILRVIRRVPPGKVVTYGQAAELAGMPRHARQVGYALAALPPRTTVPWYRVVNAKGRISMRRRPGPELTQRMLLQSEGVRFDGSGRISLRRYQWRPRQPVRRTSKTRAAATPNDN
jgi:methylated-DNA-protein-cysteine methyltransferase-like protein